MTRARFVMGTPELEARFDAVRTAVITSALAGGLQVNGSVLVELGLLVMVPGAVPTPTTTSVLVPQLHLGRLAQGASLNITVDPKYPSSVQVIW